MKKLVSAIIFMAMAVLMSVTAFAADYVPSKDIEGALSYNFSANDYFNYSRTVKSYLEEISGGYRTISCYNNVVTIDTYDSNWKHTGAQTITKSGYIFGGCYIGETYNYIVWGQNNSEESDAKEVLRIEKYAKDWKTVKGYAGVSGANTYIPFDAGSLRMTETAGKLYIHTCHEMYASDDGLHHQANMTFVVDIASMTVVDSWYDVMNVRYGYVSHSFNQFILTDGQYIYRADHGDAYPRSVVITRTGVGDDITDVNYNYMNVFSISGAIGDNFTGVSVGGFEMSADNLIIAGNSVDQNSDNIGYYSARNIFITATSKEINSSTMRYITYYTDDDDVEVCTPHLVKINDNKFLVMWEEIKDYQLYTRIAVINERGNLVSSIINTNMRLSDCKPVLLSNGLVCWYVSTSSGNTVYFVDPENIESANFGCIPAVSSLKATAFDSTSVTLSWSNVEGAKGYVIQKYVDGKWTDYETLSQGTFTRKITGLTPGTLNKFRVTAYTLIGGEKAYGGYSPELTQHTTMDAVTGFRQEGIGENTISLYWDKHPYAEGYRLQRQVNGVWEDVLATTGTSCGIGFDDEYNGETYLYRIAPYKTLNGNRLYGKYTSVLKAVRKPDAPTGVEFVGASGSFIIIGWDVVDNADGYLIQEKQESGWKQISKLTSKSVKTYRHDFDYSPGSEHIYRVVSYKTNGVSYSYSYSSAIKAYCAPAPVTDVTITSTETSLSFKWDVVSSADGYYVQVQDADGTILKSALYKSNTTTSFSASGLASGSRYTFSITPYKTNGVWRSPAPDKRIECFTNIKAISGLTCTSLGSDFISVRWNKVENAEGYMVQKMTADGWVKAADVKGNTAVSTKLTGLSAGTSYSIRVIPYIKYSNGSYRYGKSSSHITVKTAPAKVSGFAATNKTLDSITVSWNKKTDTHGYKISALKNGTVVATQYKYSLNTTTAVFEGLDKGTAYTFVIEPFISYKGKLYMGEKSAELKVITLPDAVSKLNKGAVTNSAVTFSWTTVSSADGYVIQVYKDGAWTKVISLGSGVASGYRVTGLSSKTAYQFRIVSFAKDGTTICYGRPSAVITVTTL